MTTEYDGEDAFTLMVTSFRQVTGRDLVDHPIDSRWLYESAPFALLAHDRSEDPRFFYANRTAQACFGYDWREFVGMPSRLSAEAPDRAERQCLLDGVAAKGFIANYRGLRIAKSGRRFWIEGATVWQLTRANGEHAGQAAMFHSWKDQ
ncbi:MEKHLA domain-containing protein [Ensifer adhaerens]|uniref:MEKHLA domain-containing protein n=1 Tax=Ensifer adhaerens TaxID=106592 RepID=UPI00098F0762|nr:MEKHLA domain-containing protein [Ensifer adhaerens]